MSECTCPTVQDHEGVPIKVPSFNTVCAHCRGFEYEPGTVLEDKDGDQWTVGVNGRLNDYLEEDSGSTTGLSVEYVREQWGPLKVVEGGDKDGGYGTCLDCETNGRNCLAHNGAVPVTTWVDEHLGMKLEPWQEELVMNVMKPANPFDQIPLDLFTAEVPREVATKSMGTSGDRFPALAFDVYEEAFNVLLKKNADYGPRNIADSPGGPLNGLMVRMYDKMARLRNLVESGVEPENESLRDTFLDMANYALIAMLVIDDKWPGGSND